MFTSKPVADAAVSRALSELESETREPSPQMLHFAVLTTAPVRPATGDLAFADGVSWNPGAGAGLYEYRGGAWFKL